MRPRCGLDAKSSTVIHSLSSVPPLSVWANTGWFHVIPPSGDRDTATPSLLLFVLNTNETAYAEPSGPKATAGSDARLYGPPVAVVTPGRLPVVHVLPPSWLVE